MIKFKLKVGNSVKVISGKYRGQIDIIKKIDKKNFLVYLNSIQKLKFVKSPKLGQDKTKKIFIPIHISNIVSWENK